MKKILLISILASISASLFCQNLTAKKIADNAVKKENPQEAAEYLQKEIECISEASEKRALYAFLASIQESLADYKAAETSYAKAAGLPAANIEGLPKKSSERLVLDAVRCALSAGDYTNAENYLNSAVRNSKNPEIQATIKLYEQWAALSKVQAPEDLTEALAMLKAYLTLDSMKSVKTSILLTLWYTTAEKKYAEELNKEFPSSMEAGIVKGKIQIYPAPFWYFLPRKNAAVPSIEKDNTDFSIEEKKSSEKTPDTSNTKALKAQLGLFREKANAEAFAEKVISKGFKAYIQEESRSNGAKYFTVVVDENKAGTIQSELKNAGFECYPVF